MHATTCQLLGHSINLFRYNFHLAERSLIICITNKGDQSPYFIIFKLREIDLPTLLSLNLGRSTSKATVTLVTLSCIFFFWDMS